MRVLLGLHVAAILASALLLFLMKPMFTRMVLPLLGGSPSVWNTSLLFFQAALLLGYGFAHASARPGRSARASCDEPPHRPGARARRPAMQPGVRVRTDDFADVVRVVLWWWTSPRRPAA
jgi:hypothetical protein